MICFSFNYSFTILSVLSYGSVIKRFKILITFLNYFFQNISDNRSSQSILINLIAKSFFLVILVSVYASSQIELIQLIRSMIWFVSIAEQSSFYRLLIQQLTQLSFSISSILLLPQILLEMFKPTRKAYNDILNLFQEIKLLIHLRQVIDKTQLITPKE